MSYATDTHDEKPAFVPERELQAALAEARAAARQRDELAAENTRLKRETDDVKGPDANSRRATILREALHRKDQEILWLKDHAVVRERQIAEARDAMAALKREIASAEARGRAVSGEDDRQRAEAQAEVARLTALHTAMLRERDALVHAHEATVLRERDALVHAHEAAVQQEREAVAHAREAVALAHEAANRAVEAVAYERDVALHEAAALRPLETLAATLKVRETEALARAAAAEAVAEAARSRLEATRENHAMALRAAEDDHAEEISLVRDALLASERRVESAESRCAKLEATLASERSGVAALRAELAAKLEIARGEFDAEVSALRKVCERAVEAAASAAAAQARAETEAREAREALSRAVSEAVEAAEQQAEESVRKVHEAYGAELASLREAQAAEAAAMADAHAREKSVLREQSEAHAARADGEADRASGLGRALEEAMAEGRVLATELETTRLAITEQATAAALRLEAAERALTETAGYRDRYARRLAAAMEQVRGARRESDRAAEGLAVEARALSTLVGRLTARWVLDSARVSAFQAGRLRPEAGDVDEALSWVAEEVPEPVAEELWAARDALLARCTGVSS